MARGSLSLLKDTLYASNFQAWKLKLRSRPILTSLFRATAVNAHYPRLKPQPVAMSMIIKKRRAAAVKRFTRFKSLTEMKDYIQHEAGCERKLWQNTMRNGKKGAEPMFSDVNQWSEWFGVIRKSMLTRSLQCNQSTRP